MSRVSTGAARSVAWGARGGNPPLLFRRSRRGRNLRAAGVLAAVLAGVTLTAVNMADAADPGVVQAEAFAAQSGVQVETTVDTGGGQNVGYLANGDWMRFDGVDLGPAGTLTAAARVASAGRQRHRRAADRFADRAAARPVPDRGDRRLAGVDDAVRDRHPPPRRPAAGVRGHAQHRRRRLREHQLVLVHRATARAPRPRRRRHRLGRRRPGEVERAARRVQRDAHGPRARQRGAGPGVQRRRAPTATPARTTRSSSPACPARRTCTASSATAAPTPNTTADTLLANAGTSCAPAAGPLRVLGARRCTSAARPSSRRASIVYYGSRLTDPSKTVPFPQGFRMIAGDAKLQAPTPAGHGQPVLLRGPRRRDRPQRRRQLADVRARRPTLHVPARLPGLLGRRAPGQPRPQVARRLHRTTASAPARSRWRSRRCRSSSPTRRRGTADGFTLSSGMASSMHGDSFFAWDNAAQGHRVKNCIVQKAKCNTAGTF